MSVAFDIFLLILVANLVLSLLRVLYGPHAADRLLAAQLFGTTGVAILLTLASAQHMPTLSDVALIFALLGPLAVAAYTRDANNSAKQSDDERV